MKPPNLKGLTKIKWLFPFMLYDQRQLIRLPQEPRKQRHLVFCCVCFSIQRVLGSPRKANTTTWTLNVLLPLSFSPALSHPSFLPRFLFLCFLLLYSSLSIVLPLPPSFPLFPPFFFNFYCSPLLEAFLPSFLLSFLPSSLPSFLFHFNLAQNFLCSSE